MSTSSPSDLPEQLPSSSPSLPARSDGSGVTNDKISNIPPTAGSQPARSVSAGRDWSHLPELSDAYLQPRLRRRVTLPIVLFVATCLSTFWVGSANWRPQLVGSAADMSQTIALHWRQGLTYMFAVLAILLTHEMGHFLQTVRYGIPASY